MTFSRKIKDLLVLLILINAVIVSAYWFISKEIDKNTKQVLDLNTELNLQLSREKQLRSFQDLSEDITVEREEMDSYFVSGDGTVSFITEIEELASISGVSIEIREVSVKEYLEGEKKSENIEILSLEVDTNGDWNDSFYFLNLLEAMPYKIYIKNLSLNSSGDSVADEKISVSWESTISLEVLKIK